MSSTFFFIEFRLHDRRPLAMNTHAKGQVNSIVHFTTEINVPSLEIHLNQLL